MVVGRSSDDGLRSEYLGRARREEMLEEMLEKKKRAFRGVNCLSKFCTPLRGFLKLGISWIG